MVKFCPECGINLDKDYTFCPNCGYELTQVRVELAKINSPVYNQGNITKSEKGKPRTIPSVKNNLSLVKLLSIIGGIVFLIAVTLYSSGILETPKKNEMVQTPVVNNQQPGVDLTKMNDIKVLEDKLSSNPDDNPTLLQLANLQLDSGMFESAIVNYRKYLDNNPSDADARVDMGVCYYNLKNYNEAIAVMNKAIKYNPKHQLAYINLGIVNMSAGNQDEAKKCWKKAYDLEPGSENGIKAKELLESHK
ncbi:MAG: tetratricopeptide repeat protein [Ignavibacteriaceae bacterium]|nr:tetratricopeptide repeat protein [Ignavibacteriaceae bacterium]